MDEKKKMIKAGADDNCNREYNNMETIRNVFDFSVALFQKTFSAHDNTLIAPASLLAGLAMLWSGAGGSTAEQIRKVINTDIEPLIDLLDIMFSDQSCTMKDISTIFAGKVGNPVKFANAVWMRQNSEVRFEPEYIRKCSGKLCAEVFETPFDDAGCSKINHWVREKTDGEIPKGIDSFKGDDTMYLTNAVSFDGKWETPYKPTDVENKTFFAESGEQQIAEFMTGEDKEYIVDDKAKGFIKKYASNRYEFAALVPDKGIKLQEYVENLSAEKLLSMVLNPLKHPVKSEIPKFAISQAADLKDVLCQMGIIDAFDKYKADFSGIGKVENPLYNLYLGGIRQHNKIRVNEDGTRLTASMFADARGYTCMPPEPYRVCLDHPFMYMIIDRQIGCPLFMGTVMDVQK